MASRYSLGHIDISRLARVRDYQSTVSTPRARTIHRIREEHGDRLANGIDDAFAAGDERRVEDQGRASADGVYIEVELVRGAKAAKLERRREKVQTGATVIDAVTEMQRVALFVPDTARPALKQILEDYAHGPLTEKGNPPNRAYVEQIEAIRRARLQSFWTDDLTALPEDPQAEIWWEVWCRDGFEEVRSAAERIGAYVAARDRFLFFPEQVVMPIFTSRAGIELLLFATGRIGELRRASDNPSFFTIEARGEQRDWVEDLAERTIWPGGEAPAVCLFDTGVNRAHPLIEPALAPEDAQAVNSQWGVDDHDLPFGHGTGMAGLTLHGDLTSLLAGQEVRPLRHRLESVKLLPPDGFEDTDPRNYGAVTQAAVALSEIARSDRQRVYCMAVSNLDVNGDTPTTWSAAIDQAAAGVMLGDPDDGSAPKRLFILSTGNIPDTVEPAAMRDQDAFPIEDPAQAWNALSIGGFTDKVDIVEPDLQDWAPFAEVGGLSPFSRTSVLWHQRRTPYKPDLVLEAGNRALSPGGDETLAGIESLSVLTTGRDVDRRPLDAFWATSAATAQAARMAGALMAERPDLWPETIRALVMHSADWTPAMRRQIEDTNGMRERYALLRRFGYGAPNLERALKSAKDDLALIAQCEIQPFKKSPDGPRFAEAHVYPLPWPARLLEEIENTPIRLKLTLSYFVEPNPGAVSSIDPYRYQSFGLRFDLKRQRETRSQFLQRVNALEREDPRQGPPTVPDSGWWFGAQSVSAGSLHCDVWEGPAVDLAARNMVWVYPVIGWWRERAHLGKCGAKARYGLVATITSPDVDIDLYTPIEAMVETLAAVEIEA